MNGFSYQHYLLAFLLFWLAHLTRQTLVYLRLWQMKQYRWDRLKESLREDRRVLLPRASTTSAIVLISFFVLPYWLFLVLAVINFLTWGGYALVQLVRRRWVYPQGTAKAKLFFISIWTALIVFGSVGFFLFPYYLPPAVLGLVVFFPLVSLFFLILMEWPVVLVKKRLVRKAKQYRKSLPDLTVVGITGSFGKTSVKDFLYQFLVFKYGSEKILRTKENINSQLGVAQTILKELNPEHLFFICEMGAYCPGEIAQSADLAEPKVGILTGLNAQHLSLFGSQEKIVSAKYELIESLPEDGLAFFNGDNGLCRDLYQRTGKPKFLVSSEDSSSADWQAREVDVRKTSLGFKMVGPETVSFETRLIGKQNIINLVLAGAAALKLGLTAEELFQASKNIVPPALSPRISCYHQAEIIDATYSSNPDGAKAHLDHLKLWSGRRVIVTSGFIELGQAEKESCYELGKAIGRVCHLAIFTHDRHLDMVKSGVKSVGGQTKIKLALSPEEANGLLKEFRNKEDVVLLEGRISSKIVDFLKRS